MEMRRFFMESRMRSRLALLAGLTMLLVWLLPNHYYPWASFYQDYLSFLALWFLLISLAFKGFEVGCSVVAILFCAIIPVFQVLFGLVYFFGDGAVAAFYLLGFAVAILVGREAYKSWGGAFDFLAWVFLAGAFFSSWLAICQFLEVGSSIWLVDPPTGRSTANLGQPNNLATLISLGVAALLYLFEKRRLAVLSSSLLAFVLVGGLALTLSRTPWLGLFCLLGWWLAKRRAAQLRTSPITLLAWGGVYFLVLISLPYVADALALNEIDLAARAIQSQRLALWHQMLQAVIEGPIWGYGWNQVSVAQVSVSIDHPVQILTEHSHNLVLDLLVWNGPLLGCVIVVGGSVWLARLAWRARTAESVFAVLSVGFLLLHALLEYPLEYAYFLLPCGVALGLLESDIGGGKVWQLPKYAGVVIVVVSFLTMSMVWVEYRALENNGRLIRYQSAGFGVAQPFQSPPRITLLDQLWEFVWFARTQAREGMEPEEIARMERVAHRYPYPPSLFRLSLAFGLNGYPERAAREMEVLRSVHGNEIYEEARSALESLASKYPQLKSPELEALY